MNSPISPLGDRVVLQVLKPETVTKSGLVLPDTAAEKPQEAVVLAVGPGKVAEDGKRIAIDVKEGDKVLFSKYGGTELKYNGEEFLIISSSDILGIVK